MPGSQRSSDDLAHRSACKNNQPAGIVLSRELSRLSRTDKDWCHLLELCQLFNILIADADHLYDLNLLDDQLVLGIKGTLSVVELKVLKLRLACKACKRKPNAASWSGCWRPVMCVTWRVKSLKTLIYGYKKRSNWCSRNLETWEVSAKPIGGFSG